MSLSMDASSPSWSLVRLSTLSTPIYIGPDVPFEGATGSASPEATPDTGLQPFRRLRLQSHGSCLNAHLRLHVVVSDLRLPQLIHVAHQEAAVLLGCLLTTPLELILSLCVLHDGRVLAYAGASGQAMIQRGQR